jgi:hypothetical protein
MTDAFVANGAGDKFQTIADVTGVSSLEELCAFFANNVTIVNGTVEGFTNITWVTQHRLILNITLLHQVELQKKKKKKKKKRSFKG